MKNFNNAVLLLMAILFLTNCKEKELVIPNLGELPEKEEIDLIAKPVDIKFVADYDYGYTIQWPKMSEKIAKIVVDFIDVDTITNDTTFRKFELVNFKKDTSFFVKYYKEYAFNVQAFDSEGKSSRVAVIKAWNKDLYARQLLKEASITQYGKFIRMRWNNVLNKSLKLTIKNSLISEVVNISGLTGERLIPVLDNGLPDLELSLLDNETGLVGERALSFKPHGINLPRVEKQKWTIYSDSPFNREGWWNLGESFDGEYTVNSDLDGTGKLCAANVAGAVKLNSDRRIRTLYFTFTPKRLNSDMGESIFNSSNRRPPAPYDNVLVQRLDYVFKAPTPADNGDGGHRAIFPNQLRVYGIKADGTEILVANITNVDTKLYKYKPDDGDFIKALSVDVPQATFDGATFRGIKTEFITNTLPNNDDIWDPANNIGLGEVFVIGVKTSQ